MATTTYLINGTGGAGYMVYNGAYGPPAVWGKPSTAITAAEENTVSADDSNFVRRNGGGGSYVEFRGVVNIATSPVEIFRNIYNESQYENIGYGMTVGLGKGIVQTVMRIGAGAVEIVTFPFNFPDEYKDPIVEPEYVWEEWGY